jgi:CheY-like chemotaxis protein
VRTAASVAEALEVAQEFQFDVLVSDIGLPDGRGTELLDQLEAKRGEKLPAIAMSGFGMEDDLESSRAAGFSEHLTKPVEFAALQQAIARLIARLPEEVKSGR